MVGTTRKIKVGGGWGVIFGKMENAQVIIQGDNSAEHYVLLSDLILMNFFKSFMITKLKVCTSGKSVGKKSHQRYFFPIYGLQSRDGCGET